MSYTERALSILSTQELIELKSQIDSEIRRRKSSRQSISFKLGDQVTFSHKGVTLFGCVIRINMKTISVAVDGYDDGSWLVSPGLLSPLKKAI